MAQARVPRPASTTERGTGRLTVLAPKVSWAELWIDGRKHDRATPVSNMELDGGSHRIEVVCTADVCGEKRVLMEKTVQIRPGKTTELTAP